MKNRKLKDLSMTVYIRCKCGAKFDQPNDGHFADWVYSGISEFCNKCTPNAGRPATIDYYTEGNSPFKGEKNE